MTETSSTPEQCHHVMAECLRTSADKHAMLESRGWEYLDEGLTKVVYGHPSSGFVVKLPRRILSPLHHCRPEFGMNEPRVWEDCPPSLRHFLVPLLAWGPDWQVQEKLPAEGTPTPRDCVMCCEEIEHWLGDVMFNHVHTPSGPRLFDYGQNPVCYDWEGALAFLTQKSEAA